MQNLTSEDKKLINILSKGLPTSLNPYKGMDMPEKEVLDKINLYKKEGLLRRFGATLNHYNVGYNANAMSIWIVPKNKIGTAGSLMAGYKQITHCYERKSYPNWPYNLYAMIHGKTKEECEKIAAEISTKTGICEYKLLYSTREFKKASMEYF